MVLMVLALLIVSAILGATFASTSSGAARDEHRAAMGEVLNVMAENALTESFFQIWNRLNDPRQSARFRPDLYSNVRDLAVGQSVTFEVKPMLACRTALQNGVRFSPVEVSIGLTGLTTGTRIEWRTARRPAAPAGNARNSCIESVFPVTVRERVGTGEMVLKASVKMDVAGMTIVRQVEVAHDVRIGYVSRNPNVAWVDVVPIRKWTKIDREAGK
jgi:hypothetical protein